jgi:GrpB-like predicted nucleotidyltransferase (UPF0157 family)
MVQPMSEPVEIRDYDSTWPDQFEVLAGRVRVRLGHLVRRVEHVGSTAVPGLPAKPIIDLDVVVASDAGLTLAITRLAEMGYGHEGDLGISGRHAFLWPPSEPRHHLYLLTEGAEELHRHIAFRDALRANPDLRARYAMLKGELAHRCYGDRAAYTRGKAEFIESVLGQI